MNMKSIIFLQSILLVFVVMSVLSQTQKPPVAKKVPKADTLHGDVRIDNYHWIRDVDRKNPEVIQFLNEENEYTGSYMKPMEALQETLYNEMIRRIKETDEDPPYKEGDFWYYSKTEKGKQYPIYCRKKGSLDSRERIYFDQNELAEGSRFYRVATMERSPDQDWLAFSVDTNGSENYVLQIMNMGDGDMMRERVENTESMVWAMDSQTLFYTVEDSAKRPYRVFRHTFGEDVKNDELVYEETDALYTVGVGRSRSDKYIFIVSSASNSDEWRYISAESPEEQFKLIAPRRPEFEYSVDHNGDYFYIRTNKEATTFKLMKAPVSDPGEQNWIDLIPHRKEVTLEGTDFFKDFMVVYEREKGLQKIRVTDLRSNSTHYINFPEPVYTASGNVNLVYETNIFRYSYQSMTTPATIYDYNLETKEQTLIKRQEVLGGYDPNLYQTERIYAKAEDGTEVPISLVYKKGVPIDGTAPLHLYSYGSYGSSTQPTFSSARLSYLDRGVIFALAHIRGGGDMGREWYDNGKLHKKMNTFTDFIACAEHLIAQKYTSKEKLTISGGSAGGLLMGAVTNMRPDLFKAVVASVPFVDVLNTMLDPSLMYTEQEYLEWGNPNVKADYDYMKTYCPYTNVKAQNYPNMLVKVGFNDPRVNYWEGTKFVAKIRDMKTDNNTVLLKVNMGAGHMGSSGRYERLREAAFDYAYILSQYGLTSLEKPTEPQWKK